MVPPSRRQTLRASLAAGAATLAGCLSGFGAESRCSEGRTAHESDTTLSGTATWPAYQYDAANTGHNRTADGPDGEVSVAWRHSVCTEAESGVVVAGGQMYAGGFVVDGQTGQAHGGDWHGHFSTPTVADEMLYSSSHDLEARDATTGEIQWTFQTDLDAGALPAATVADGTVYVPGGINDPTAYAIDAETGAERWRFDTSGDIGVPVAVVEETVYAVDRENIIYALDGATGAELWRRSMASTCGGPGLSRRMAACTSGPPTEPSLRCVRPTEKSSGDNRLAPVSGVRLPSPMEPSSLQGRTETSLRWM